MSVRTSMEIRERVEITFSFDNEGEANEWITQFQQATEAYNKAKEGDHPGKANGPVPKPPGGRGMEVKAAKGKPKLIV